MREMSVTEQRYKAILAVDRRRSDGGRGGQGLGISRRTMHRWLARYEGDGLEALGNRSSRPAHCPHQTPPAVEVIVLEFVPATPVLADLIRSGVQFVSSDEQTSSNSHGRTEKWSPYGSFRQRSMGPSTTSSASRSSWRQ